MGVVVPEPLFALDLIRNHLAGNSLPLVKFVHEQVSEPEDLAIIDASMLLVIKTLENRVRRFASLPFLSEDTWRAIIKLSQQNVVKDIELNQEWLAIDAEEFLSEVVSPMIASGRLELLLPSESVERSTPDDEFLIHAVAVVNIGLSFIRGVSSTIGNYGDTEAIIARLDEYFSLQESREVEYEPFSWEDGY